MPTIDELLAAAKAVDAEFKAEKAAEAAAAEATRLEAESRLEAAREAAIVEMNAACQQWQAAKTTKTNTFATLRRRAEALELALPAYEGWMRLSEEAQTSPEGKELLAELRRLQGIVRGVDVELVNSQLDQAHDDIQAALERGLDARNLVRATGAERLPDWQPFERQLDELAKERAKLGPRNRPHLATPVAHADGAGGRQRRDKRRQVDAHHRRAIGMSG